jgi:hypothetical protein
VFTQELHCRCRVFNCFCFVESLIQLKRFVNVVAFVGQFDTRFLPPEKIGTNDNETVSGIPVGDTSDVLIYAEDFLEHDDAWTITTCGCGHVGVELAAVEGFDCDPGRIVIRKLRLVNGDVGLWSLVFGLWVLVEGLFLDAVLKRAPKPKTREDKKIA